MIFARKKQEISLLKEFNKYVLKNYTDANRFISEVLIPYKNAYSKIKKCKYTINNTHKKDELILQKIEYYLSWLNSVKDSDWLPVAIKFSLLSNYLFFYIRNTKL